MSCSPAGVKATSRRWTREAGRSCGRRAWARRSSAVRSPTKSTANSTSPPSRASRCASSGCASEGNGGHGGNGFTQSSRATEEEQRRSFLSVFSAASFLCVKPLPPYAPLSDTRKLHAANQLLEARLAAQGLEPRNDVEEHDREIVFLIGLLEPVERLGFVAQPRIHQRHRRRRHILAIGHGAQLGERLFGLRPRAFQSVRKAQMPHRNGA